MKTKEEFVKEIFEDLQPIFLKIKEKTKKYYDMNQKDNIINFDKGIRHSFENILKSINDLEYPDVNNSGLLINFDEIKEEKEIDYGENTTFLCSFSNVYRVCIQEMIEYGVFNYISESIKYFVTESINFNDTLKLHVNDDEDITNNTLTAYIPIKIKNFIIENYVKTGMYMSVSECIREKTRPYIIQWILKDREKYKKKYENAIKNI